MDTTLIKAERSKDQAMESHETCGLYRGILKCNGRNGH